VVSTGSAIQATVLFSTLLGVAFLWQINGLFPPPLFGAFATGWALFVVDSALTFMRPNVSYVLAFCLALLVLAASLPQSAHYAFIQEGAVLPAATFAAGSLAQVLLVMLVPYHFLRRRRPAVGVVQGQ